MKQNEQQTQPKMNKIKEEEENESKRKKESVMCVSKIRFWNVNEFLAQTKRKKTKHKKQEKD